MTHDTVLVKIHNQTILSIETFEMLGHPNIDLREDWEAWMNHQDFRESTGKLFNAISPHLCDVSLWELKRLVDEMVAARQEELRRLGVSDDRTEAPHDPL